MWQVSGRADLSFEQQIDLDLRYIRERSLFTDIVITAKTIPAVLLGAGAY
ncbi:sugar transferase [Zhongshania sp.]